MLAQAAGQSCHLRLRGINHMASPHREKIGPRSAGQFWSDGVGAGGLATFWDEFLGKKYYMSEKKFLFFTKFGGS